MKKYALEIMVSIVVLVAAFVLFGLSEYLYANRPLLQTSDQVIQTFMQKSSAIEGDSNYQAYVKLATHCN
jgi:hypothetical protein